jgi:hypothetical protein
LGVLLDRRDLRAPELDAHHTSLDVRTPFLRVGHHAGRNVTSDYALVERAAPFLHRLKRPAVSVLLAGRGRFEEQGSRAFFEAGALVSSDQCREGTEAYSGSEVELLVLEWDPERLGSGPARPFTVERLNASELVRLREAARALHGPDPAAAAVECLRVLRAAGVALEEVSARELGAAEENERRLQSSLATALSQLGTHPAVEDLVRDLGWNPRLVHRRITGMADRYALAYDNWRGALGYARTLGAVRLLSAPGATTDNVARLAGFRAATALCHAFAERGLPSPGSIAKAARKGALEYWTEL